MARQDEQKAVKDMSLPERSWLFTQSYTGVEKTRTGARATEKYYNVDDVYNAAFSVKQNK